MDHYEKEDLSIGKDFINMFDMWKADGFASYGPTPCPPYNIRYTHFGIFSVLL